ncbi:MAG: GTPase HflX [Oscillospiraceae bacterium]|jgi:GTP-binding protein HflX|nr:GTPase HflX [Oscillospiraceae bacterium]
MEKAILVGLSSDALPIEERADERSLAELAALLETAGGVSVGTMLQRREKPEPGTFIGTGKVDELRRLLKEHECELALFDNALSPAQQRNLEERLDVRVMDRAGIILDIFASRAHTKEGRLQVELAQYRYLLPRLTGMWTHLVRQTASGASRIGTRGPGETQLETDRRHIRSKITKLEHELEKVRGVRTTQRRLREKNEKRTVALVGYTNAGKSSLLNALTDAGIQARGRLFDTLDTTTRRLRLPDGSEVLLSDTVGFIRKLPHQLVAAFKATLEELAFADVVLHVIDVANPDWQSQSEVCERLISELGAGSTPRLDVFNKCDLEPGAAPRGREDSVCVSSKTGEGLDALLSAITEKLALSATTVDGNIIRSDYAGSS